MLILHLKEKIFHIFENLLKTSRTSTKVVNFSHPPDWPLNSLQETLVRLVLKSFITVFFYNEGLENALTRAPLLGLAKSIH